MPAGPASAVGEPLGDVAKLHHTVPQFYLRGFADASERITIVKLPGDKRYTQVVKKPRPVGATTDRGLHQLSSRAITGRRSIRCFWSSAGPGCLDVIRHACLTMKRLVVSTSICATAVEEQTHSFSATESF